MTRTTTTTLERGAVELVLASGRRLNTERTFTSIDDWRQTAIGPVNFGSISWGPERWIYTDDGSPCGDPIYACFAAEKEERRRNSVVGRLRRLLRL